MPLKAKKKREKERKNDQELYIYIYSVFEEQSTCVCNTRSMKRAYSRIQKTHLNNNPAE